jgi:hypothetical protein
LNAVLQQEREDHSGDSQQAPVLEDAEEQTRERQGGRVDFNNRSISEVCCSTAA